MHVLLKAAVIWLSLCVTISVKGQIGRDTSSIRPLPHINGWTDNSHYILEKRVTGSRTTAYSTIDIRTGAELLYSPVKRATVLRIEAAQGDIFLITDSTRKQLTHTIAEERTSVLSPDGRWVAFTRQHDLYAIELSTLKEIRYTHDGSDVILNGVASWVYYEEILGRDSKYCSFWWSPDSRHIAFFRYDESKVPVFPLFNALGQHGVTEYTRYPKAGDPNPSVQVGIVATTGGKVVWAGFDARVDQYFGQPFWRPDGSGLLVQWMPREQNNLKLFHIDPASGAKTELYNEVQATWVEWIDRLTWLKDGFVMVRDLDGWEQLYYHAHNGVLKKKLTSGRNWKTAIVKVDEAQQLLYYKANAEASTRTDLYCVSLQGKAARRLTFGDYSHGSFSIAPDGRHFICNFSNAQTPPRLALVDTRHGSFSVLADAKGVAFDSAAMNTRRVVWLRTADGFDLPGSITFPSNMEKGRRYPVSIRVYGGPGAGSVTDSWYPSGNHLDKVPVINIFIEHRGSGHNGKQGMNFLHRHLGQWEMVDYISWMKWLRTNPAVDTNRIMISGGSYGGYLTALALTLGSEYFHYGIADYPVTDWALYDSHYTERYMDLPADNPEGYAVGSVLTHAAKYQQHGPSMLLLQHGVMDDNVHVQHTYQLADKLQRLNKPFELMIYPTERHGWLGPKASYTFNNSERFRGQYLYGHTGKKDTVGKKVIVQPKDTMPDMVNIPAPAFTVKDIYGKQVSLSDFKGKTIVVDLWATWCRPCVKSFPAMQQTVNRYRNDPDVQFLFIHTWEFSKTPLRDAMNFLQKNHYDLPLYVDEKDSNRINPAVTAFGVKGIPAKFIIDKAGYIRFTVRGFSGNDDAAISALSAMIERTKHGQ